MIAGHPHPAAKPKNTPTNSASAFDPAAARMAKPAVPIPRTIASSRNPSPPRRSTSQPIPVRPSTAMALPNASAAAATDSSKPAESKASTTSTARPFPTAPARPPASARPRRKARSAPTDCLRRSGTASGGPNRGATTASASAKKAYVPNVASQATSALTPDT